MTPQTDAGGSLPDSARIFCIGLNKTGTISLHRALETLGFRSLHWGGPASGAKVGRALREGRPLVEDFPGVDAFSDIAALSKRFALLDQQYPGSRFILTTRPIEGWVTSRRAHVLRNRERAEAGDYTGSFLTIEPDAWRQEFVDHHDAVASYFRGRDDLLTMRITDGDGYEALCPFLGRPPPSEPFPHQHKAANLP